MMRKNAGQEFIESCWEEIEKPKKKQPNKKVQSIKQPNKNKDNDQATPFEIAMVVFLIILCLIIVLIGTALK